MEHIQAEIGVVGCESISLKVFKVTEVQHLSFFVPVQNGTEELGEISLDRHVEFVQVRILIPGLDRLENGDRGLVQGFEDLCDFRVVLGKDLPENRVLVA